MATPTDHSKLSISVLETNLNRLVAKMDDLELEDEEKNAGTITKIKKKILEYQSALDAKIIEPKPEPANATTLVATQSTNPLGTPDAKFCYNSMVSHFKANVPTLQPPLDVSIFIQRLQNCYNLYVKQFPALEPYFVQQAKGHLSMDILETINAADDKTETFEELQLYLKKNFGSRETPFQLLSSLMDMDIKEGEKLQEFAGRLERKTATVVTQINAKFKNQESNKDDSSMNASDCFNLFSSMLFYDHLRKKRPTCFNLMVKDVDNCWRPSDLGSMAATLVDRMDIPDQSQVANHAFSARPNQRQQKSNSRSNKNAPAQGATSRSATSRSATSNEICRSFLKNQSCFHFKKFGKCKFKHLKPGDAGYEKAMRALNEQSTNTKPNQPSNTHVATAKSYSEEMQPEDVGLDAFGYYSSKN